MRNRWVDPVLCEHGSLAGLLRNGTPRCPVCRRHTPPPEPTATVPTIKPPRVDTAALAAHDDTLWKDEPR